MQLGASFHTPTDDDRAAMASVIRDIEDGFNHDDADPMTRHFAVDAVATGANGVALVGVDAIRAAHEAGVAGFLRDQYVRYTVVDVRTVAPGVALLRKTAQATDRNGAPVEQSPSMCALYVLVRTDGRWRIAARQNTLIPRTPPTR